jgi:hypothetical protein
MITFAGGFLIFFSVVWTAILLTVSHSVGASAPASIANMLRSMVLLGYGLGGFGALLLVVGLISRRSNTKKAMDIFRRGTLTTGNVTFVDKDYSVLVNNAPVFSIVEFTFQDSRGDTHTTRKTGVNSELVIRNRIAVGGQVAIKYLPENPDSNILIMQDPSVVQGGAVK